MAEYEDFREPQGEQQRAGARSWAKPKTPYDEFMQEEGIPLRRGIGIHDVRELPLEPWKRLGGRGSYIQLDGTDNMTGMYVVEIPSAGALNVERHIYEEIYYVVEGRGTTEVWREGSENKHVFEWQAGSLFAVPLNVWHRLVNATSSPAILIAGTTAPPTFNLFKNKAFIFDNPFEFTDRYDGSQDYYKPNDDLKADPMMSRAMRVTNIIPDILNCELPLDNQRSPGYRRVNPRMGSGAFSMFVGQYLSGRYAMAHHPQGPGSSVLICVRGKGYTFTWPRHLGVHPWESGNGQLVERQDYVAGGMVCSNPGGTEWFHAHYGVGKEPLRLLVFRRTENMSVPVGRPGEMQMSGNLPLEEGGRSITYQMEDPYVREYYKKRLSEEGVEFQMPDWVYTEKLPTDHVLAADI